MEGKGFTILNWKPNFNPHEVSVNTVLIWLKFIGLPQEYKDLETLRQIGNKLGKFVMTEEAVDSFDFSMFSRLCINWQPIHKLLDTIKIKTGLGIWKQNILMEEPMESCSKCKAIAHLPGSYKNDDKGKEALQKQLAEDIIRLSEGNLWEQHWNEVDWVVLHSFK